MNWIRESIALSLRNQIGEMILMITIIVILAVVAIIYQLFRGE